MSEPQNMRALRVVNALDLPAGATFADLHHRVERAYGKKIIFRPLSDELLEQCTGLWVDRDTHGTIHYRPKDPLVYASHSNCHEFGHILLGHTGCSLLELINVQKLGSAGLGGAIKNIRMRDLRSNPEERDAEEVATLLVHKLLSRPVPPEHEVFG